MVVLLWLPHKKHISMPILAHEALLKQAHTKEEGAEAVCCGAKVGTHCPHFIVLTTLPLNHFFNLTNFTGVQLPLPLNHLLVALSPDGNILPSKPLPGRDPFCLPLALRVACRLALHNQTLLETSPFKCKISFHLLILASVQNQPLLAARGPKLQGV
jgi:hypothetical protein